MRISEAQVGDAVRASVRKLVAEDRMERARMREELIGELRSRMVRCKNINEDVMRKYYGIKANMCRPIRIDEKITLDRVINKHGDNGYVSISANRSENDDETNAARTRSLLSDIKKSGYAYLPTYGGYRAPDGSEVGDYEPSFLVFNYDKSGEELDFDRLRQLAIDWCGKYNQDCVMVKAPQEAPIYLDRDGMKVNSSESDKVFKNDPNQEYFTSLKDKPEVDSEINGKLMGKYKTYCHRNNIPVTREGFEEWKEDHLTDIDSIGRRFTNDIQFECYINPIPQNLNEMRMRGNEIYPWSF